RAGSRRDPRLPRSGRPGLPRPGVAPARGLAAEPRPAAPRPAAARAGQGPAHHAPRGRAVAGGAAPGGARGRARSYNRPSPGATRRPLAVIHMNIESKLPSVGTTIFTVMSALAEKHSAINLGQGFPDFDCDRRLVDAVTEAMAAGKNQYPPMAGVPALREAIARKIDRIHGVTYDPATEVTVTAGATQALLTALLAVVRTGDEVIVIEPVYDSYRPGIELSGGRAVAVPMTADYRIDWERIAASIGPATRAIMVNSPHNPTGTVMDVDDVEQLAALAERHDLLVLSAEVAERLVFDGGVRRSLSAPPALRERSFVVSSFGKTFHVTGWKVGYCVAPAPLMSEFRKVHQFNVFTVNT